MLASTASVKHCVLNGILRIGGQRNFKFSFPSDNIFLVCNTFWKEEPLFVRFLENGAMFKEAFKIENGNQFLEKVRNNYLKIQISKMGKNMNFEVIGSLMLPLQQFYIAYRDASLTNRLCDEQFPVISTNKWVSVSHFSSGEEIGEIECLLAMGTEKQIENIEKTKFNTSKAEKSGVTESLHAVSNVTAKHTSKSKTSDLLNILQKSLPSTNCYNSLVPPEMQFGEINSFRLILEIKSARNLQAIQSFKLKNKNSRSATTKGYQNLNDGTLEEPSTYVTFQAIQSNGITVKSHEGMVYSTQVIEKNSNPVWNMIFHLSASTNYLINKKEKFIVKVWKRARKANAHCQNKQCPIEDAMIGFAKIDLLELAENCIVINDWFDIVDFSGHINGQINIEAKLVDDVNRLKGLPKYNQVESFLENFESSLDINNMNLCRAIKRKFTELEEISERLRMRLFDVTESATVDALQIDKDITDEQLEEFEHDLNTSVCEDEHEFLSTNRNCFNATEKSSNSQ